MKGRLENEMKLTSSTEAKVNSMPEYVKMWYNHLRASDNTAYTCREYVYVIYDFLHSIDSNVSTVTIDKITRFSVESYIINSKTCIKDDNIKESSKAYRQIIWYALNNFMKYMNVLGIMDCNYMDSISKPKSSSDESKKKIMLTQNDFQKILKATDEEKNEFKKNRDKAILILFMTTGIRKDALRSINISDINFESKEFAVVDKGNKVHLCSLTDSALGVINEWIKIRGNWETDALFLSNRGNRISRTALDHVVEKYCLISMGKHISPHKLRAGFCSILYNKTGDIEFVRQAVGHSSPNITKRYIVTDGNEKRRAANLLSGLT